MPSSTATRGDGHARHEVEQNCWVLSIEAPLEASGVQYAVGMEADDPTTPTEIPVYPQQPDHDLPDGDG
jgi:hypothetical protein